MYLVFKKSLFISALTIAFFCHSVLLAGDGRIENGKVDLTVMFNYNETDPDSWKPLFEEFSKLLYNATEKQLQLGEVKVTSCNHIKEKADIWILEEDGCSFADPLSIGVPNTHLTLYQNHKDINGSNKGHFGLMQAFAHYAFGLYDEHKGKLNGAGPWMQGDAFFCVSNGDSIASLMDGGSTIDLKNQRFEFCTDPALGYATSHQTGYTDADGNLVETAQEILNGEDCWSTIVSNSGLSYPSSEPQDDISGIEPITWTNVESVNRLSLCIDRSGSMVGSKIDLARTGSKVFVDLAHFGEELAVTSFASSAGTDYALQLLQNQQDKENAKAAIDALIASGATSIGAGLRQAMNEVTNNGNNPQGCAEVIVLLSDGRHNTGESPQSVLPEIIERGIRVYTIGLGADVDAQLMSDIAFQTGGSYQFASDEGQLANIFAKIYAETRAEDNYHSVSGEIAAGNIVLDNVLVDGFTQEITFEANWASGNNLEVTLLDPSGALIDPAAASSNSNIQFVDGDVHKYYRISSPDQGEWTVQLNNNTSLNIAYNLIASGSSPDLSTRVRSDRSSYIYPQNVVLAANIIANVPVSGVEVTGLVTRPDQTTTTVTLHDDGSKANGDKIANDGVYSAIFSDFAGSNGSYTFKITMKNTQGVESARDQLPFVEEGCSYTPEEIPDFVRVGEFSTVIEGVPQTLVMKTFEMDYARINFRNTHHIVAQGNFEINDVSNSSFDPVDEDVTVKLGNYEETIPAGSFVMVEELGPFKLGQGDTTIWLYEGGSIGHIEKMYCVTVDGHSGMFGFAGYGMDMTPTLISGSDDVPVMLQIGDDKGVNAMDMNQVFPKLWVYGKRVRVPEVFPPSHAANSENNGGAFTLEDNHPNPFNPTTTISFTIPEQQKVKLEIVNSAGQVVAVLVNGQFEPGRHSVSFNAAQMASGVYFYRLRAGAHSSIKKMILLK